MTNPNEHDGRAARLNEHGDLAAWLLGLLDDDEAVRFEDHLANCPTCQHEAAQLDGMPGLLSDHHLQDGPLPSAEVDQLPITIYVADEGIHEQVESAVERLLSSARLEVSGRDEPEFGSWFRRMRASLSSAANSQLGRDIAMTAAHAAESRLVLAQDAEVTETLMRNLGEVLTSLQPTKDAVIRIGAVLVVKTDWAVSVQQLTPAQQLMLNHNPNLAKSPHKILDALTGPSALPDSPADQKCHPLYASLEIDAILHEHDSRDEPGALPEELLEPGGSQHINNTEIPDPTTTNHPKLTAMHDDLTTRPNPPASGDRWTEFPGRGL